MLSIRRTIVGIAVTALALSAVPGGAVARFDDKRDDNRVVRFATFNASLNRNSAGQLIQDLSTPNNDQAKTVAEIVQRNRPDVLLINEFDFDAGHEALRLFQDNYLSVEQNGARSINYEYAYTAPSNTGIPSGFDLNNDGSIGGPDDAFGFGFFPGQFGMALYSRYPIDVGEIRTFQNFLWADMPGARLPDDASTPAPDDWFSPEELEVVRLSSKSHWDVPIEIGRRTVHVLAAHPTPPVFDGPEDRNGLRNFDEIGFWSDYVSPRRGQYIYDDDGETGGLASGEPYVIMGDYNSDPNDGDSVVGAIQQILDLPHVRTKITPSSKGGPEQAELQGGINETHISDPAFDTADFADTAPGNLRVDYVLPSRPLKLTAAKVFWPLQNDPLFRLVGVFPFPSSDHRLVWADVDVPDGRR
ncbi:MAG: endonuclease/exonuclease/phosphatase family protein [Actinobacteria bacterium]|nr:endonuclease/exonuclease/phosphatase family protein [Actinomycetota bacterium]